MSPSSEIQQLCNFIINNVQYLEFDNGTSDHLSFPSFELTPFDYLEFAQKELSNATVVNKINCVGHLKRAADCALDTLLQVLNVYRLFKQRNLKFEKKIDLVGKMGIFNSRSLNKLNKIRNRVEHEYSAPKIDDLELYFELVQGFIIALEGYMNMLASNAEMEFWSQDTGMHRRLFVKYNFELPSIIFHFDEAETKVKWECDTSNIGDFAFATKIFFLLCRYRFLINSEFVVTELKASLETPEQDGSEKQNAG